MLISRADRSESALRSLVCIFGLLFLKNLCILTARIAKERDVKEFDWTRRGPLPAPEPAQRRVPDRSTFGRALDNVSDAGSDRPSRRNFESDGKPRDFGNWERKGPLSPVGGAPAPREGGRRSSPAPAWGEGRSQEGSRPPRRELQERTPTAAELDNSWRSKMRPDAQTSNPPSPAAAPASPAAAPAVPAAPAAPASRPRLNLQKRTVTQEVLSPASGTESKASPFGGAKPIDTATREKQVEERRQVTLRQKKEADDKTKAEKAEKAEKQRSAKEQAKAEKPESNEKEGGDVPQGGKNFDILRRTGEEESGMAADQEPAEEAAKAAAASQEAPAAQSNGNWRSGPAEAEAAGDDEGWSTVSARQRNNRRGGRAHA